MRKSTLILGLVSITLLGINSCSKEIIKEENQFFIQEQEILSKTALESYILNEVETSGKIFEWSMNKPIILWSGIRSTNFKATIGFKTTEGFKLTNISKSTKKEVLKTILSQKSEGKDALVLKFDDSTEEVNYIDVKIKDITTLKKIIALPNVRFIEPAGFTMETVFPYTYARAQRTGYGCTNKGATIASEDSRTIKPGCELPWNFDKHKIYNAWSKSTGKGIGIGYIDTGVSNNQKLLKPWKWGGFNDGWSNGRTISRIGAFKPSGSTGFDGYKDQCGHGTSMIALGAAPRNNDGLPVGVAYNCNVISYRATEDVILNTAAEEEGVARAIRWAGSSNRLNLKIISVSVGYLYSISKIKDAIKRADKNGKLVVASAGTSPLNYFTGVTFPGNMSETIAATGVKESGYVRSLGSHVGSKVDVTIAVERANGNTTPTLGYDKGKADYVSGSSTAASITSGIAALIWAKYPNWDNKQVKQRLLSSGEFYPNKNSKFGYGNINALKAVQ